MPKTTGRKSSAAPRKQRSDKGKKHGHPEAALRAKIFAAAEAEFPDAHYVGTPNGLFLAGGARAGAQAVKEGMKRGFPDSLMFNAGRDGSVGLAIEFKVVYDCGRVGKLDADQEKWFANLRACGWRYACSRAVARCCLLLLLVCSLVYRAIPPGRCEIVYTVDDFRTVAHSHLFGESNKRPRVEEPTAIETAKSAAGPSSEEEINLCSSDED